MGLMDVLKISGGALKANRTRMETIASNLANAQTTRTEEGGPYKKKEVIFRSTVIDEGKAFSDLLSDRLDTVKVEDIVESEKPNNKIYEPSHPDADESGYVALPNVNVMEEMADMTAAARAYEANVNMVNTAKEMFMKALEIIR
jgi:flagellar basal-body rod protein FlgC